MKVFAWRKKATSLLKTGFLVILDLKEGEKKKLKLFENQSRIKIIWKTGVLKIKFWQQKMKKWENEDKDFKTTDPPKGGHACHARVGSGVQRWDCMPKVAMHGCRNGPGVSSLGYKFWAGASKSSQESADTNESINKGGEKISCLLFYPDPFHIMKLR